MSGARCMCFYSAKPALVSWESIIRSGTVMAKAVAGAEPTRTRTTIRMQVR